MQINLPWAEIFTATWQTIYMVFIASFFSILFGLIVGVFLFFTRKNSLKPSASLHHVLSFIVNIGRSIPYIILMIALIPLTRVLVGTSIGINAAIVPLTIAAIPFYARIAEVALNNVPTGLIEAGHAMGANIWQLTFKILLPESLPELIKGASLTIIGLVGYSAMAGAVGGGGLGELAINYGYQRFNVNVMLATIVILVVLVQLIQMLGDHLAKKTHIKLIFIIAVIGLLFCTATQVWPKAAEKNNVLRVGVMSGAEEDIMKVAQQVAWQKYHLHLQLVVFNDYVLPNTALNNGNLDANIFQHVPYLNAQIAARHYQLIPIAKTFIYPMGFYSIKYHQIQQVPDGASIAIPNDPSNEGRALLILQKAQLINLASNVGLKATIENIVANPHQFKFIEMDAAQIPRALSDVAMGALTNDYVGPAGFTVNQALLKEGPDSPYANVIVVRISDQHRAIFNELIAVMHSKPVVDATIKAFPNGAAIPAF